MKNEIFYEGGKSVKATKFDCSKMNVVDMFDGALGKIIVFEDNDETRAILDLFHVCYVCDEGLLEVEFHDLKFEGHPNSEEEV